MMSRIAAAFIVVLFGSTLGSTQDVASSSETGGAPSPEGAGEEFDADEDVAGATPDSGRGNEWTLAFEGLADLGEGAMTPGLTVARRFGRLELSLILGYQFRRNELVAGATRHIVTTRFRVGVVLAETRMASLLWVGEFGYAGGFETIDSVSTRIRSGLGNVGFRGAIYPSTWLSFRCTVGVSYAVTGGTERVGVEHRFGLINPLTTVGAAVHW